MAIQSFSDKATEDFFVHGLIPRKAGWAKVANVAKRKLDMLHYAHQLIDLKSPPGNKLEALTKNLKGYHSIRINDQWRVVFRWMPVGAVDVSIQDYH